MDNPLENIDIEYPVVFGSKKGFVDIALFKYIGTKKVPFLFIEVKQEIDDNSIKQLESYLAVVDSCTGMIIDGNKIINLGKEDIPVYTEDMAPKTLNIYTYIDLKKDRKLELLLDSDSIELEISYGEKITESYKKNQLNKIPIYGRIAAGEPLFMNLELDEELYLPDEVVSGECFALKVSGDSMTGADINDGDYVILREDFQCNTGDIIAAAIGEEATLKRVMKMRNAVVLVPENDDYEGDILE